MAKGELVCERLNGKIGVTGMQECMSGEVCCAAFVS